MPFSDAIRIGASGAGDYEVERSLRFNRDDDAYLQATLGNSNLNKWTLSIWVKKPVNGEHQAIFSSGDSSVSTMVNFDNSDRLKFTNYPGSAAGVYITTRKFRDPSAWYHIVAIWDSGNSTAGDRIRLYVNGVRETAFDQSDNPNQDQDSVINGNTQGDSTWGQGKHRIGRYSNYADNSGCYYAEVNFIDGQAYDPSSFAETDAVTGEYKPKKYTGGYGTNGFYLNFSDNSGTTATTLGKDSSGNGNNFTPNNFSVSTGTGNDSVTDTPTNNFCTLNALHKDGQTTLSNGNLQASGSQTSTYNINTQGTFAQSSGKWYYEVEFTSGSGSCAVGWARTTLRSSDNPTTGGGIVYRPTNGDYVDLAANNPTTPPTTSTGTVIQVAIDFDAGKIWFGSGGTYFNSGDPSAGSNEAMTFTGGSELLAPVVRTMAATFNFNFGQRAFSYTVPTGFKKLNSANLPDPTIAKPNQHFDTLLWTGDGGTRTISGLNFSPDWVWVKNRSNAYHHGLFDAVRGANKVLKSSATSAEGTFTQQLISFNSNGFSLGDNGDGGNYVNINGHTYVGWNWNAGGSTVTNNDGANASQVRANTTAGFSIVTYTGTGSTTTFGHGLGVAPQVVITKARSDTSSWAVLHTVGDPTAENRLLLNDNGAYSSYQGYKLWNDTVPTSSVFTVREDAATNASSVTYVAYCFSEVSSFSKFGKYIGNGDNDGTFVYTGFKVKWLLIKRTSAEHWILADTARNSVSGRKSPADSYLLASASNAESTGIIYDMLSNGVKFRSNSQNESGSTYIYMAFAESPFKYARAR